MMNKFCDMVGIEFPLVAFSHCRDVVVAVSKAGGFGVFGAAAMDAEQMKIELDWIDAHIDGKPYGLDLAIPENMPNKEAEHETTTTLSEKIPAEHHKFVNDLLKQYDINTDTHVRADEASATISIPRWRRSRKACGIQSSCWSMHSGSRLRF